MGVIVGIVILIGIPIALVSLLVSMARRIRRLEQQYRTILECLDLAIGTGGLADTSETTPKIVTSDREVANDALKSVIKPLPRQIEQSLSRDSGAITWEERLLKKWLPLTGMLAIVTAVIFFLKYAFDNAWLGPSFRVMLGLATGLGFVAIGEYFYSKKRYEYYRAVLAGGGIGLMYLAIYAAHGFYELLPTSITFLFLVLVTVTAGVLASRRKVPVIAVLGLIIGFVTPVALSTGEDHGGYLLLYLLVLDSGVLWFARRENWRYLDLLGLLGTIIVTIGWYEEFGAAYSFPARWLPMWYAVAIFVVFTTASAIRHVTRGVEPVLSELIVLVGTPLFAFGLGGAVIDQGTWKIKGIYTLGLAVIYLSLAMVQHRLNPGQPLMLTLFSALALGFITLAIPIQMTGRSMVLAWVVEGTVLFVVGLGRNLARIRSFGALVLLLGSGYFWLTAVAEGYGIQVENSFWNPRFLTASVVIVFLGLASLAVRRIHRPASRMLSLEAAGIEVAFHVQVVWNLATEIWSRLVISTANVTVFKDRAHIIVTLFLTLYSLGLVSWGFRLRSQLHKVMAVILFVVTTAKLFLFDLSTVQPVYRIIVALVFGLIVLATSYWYYRSRESQPTEAEKEL